MGSPQLTYGDPAIARPGYPAHGSIEGHVASRSAETASIDFGLVVGAGTSDEQCVIGGATPLGVAIRNPAQPMDEDDDGQYLTGDSVSILDKDFVFVTVTGTGAYGDPINYNTTTGALDVGPPESGEKFVGWLAQTLGTAGLAKIFIDARSSYIGGILADMSEAADALKLTYVGTSESITWTADAI